MGRVRPCGQSESRPGDKYSQSPREGGSLLQQSPALQLSPQRNPRGRARREQVSWIVLEEKRVVSCLDPVHTFPILGTPPLRLSMFPSGDSKRQVPAGAHPVSWSRCTEIPKSGFLPGLPRTLLSSTVGGRGGEEYPLCHSTGRALLAAIPRDPPHREWGEEGGPWSSCLKPTKAYSSPPASTVVLRIQLPKKSGALKRKIIKAQITQLMGAQDRAKGGDWCPFDSSVTPRARAEQVFGASENTPHCQGFFPKNHCIGNPCLPQLSYLAVQPITDLQPTPMKPQNSSNNVQVKPQIICGAGEIVHQVRSWLGSWPL